ncbi:MAG: Fis family transcriptional regulator [Leptolyngbyaceae cyanobacterium bins.302]|nr:Fis family transcriptional regulator [Leptolyngbyaceae cyanobacterium bins.302]
MTANFDSQNSDHQSLAGNQRQPSRAPDVLQRDRFELLSAYMDGEVSADERRQVEDWLANDPTVQRLHSRLLKLRQAFQTMPVPVADEQSVQHTVDAVLSRVDRRPRLSVVWGGIAIAAVAIGAMTSALLGDNPFAPQVAQNPEQPSVEAPVAQEEPLLIALDKPLVSIPENQTGAPKRSVNTPDSSNTIR